MLRSRSLTRGAQVNDTRLSTGRPERFATWGIRAWFESDFGVAKTVLDVDTWTCKATGFVSTGTTTARPTYTASDTNFNGKPSLNGTAAASTQLTNTTDTPFTAGLTRTMFFVFKATNGAGTNGCLYDSRHAATGRPVHLWGDLTGAAFVMTDAVAINATIPTPTSLTAKHMLAEVWTLNANLQVWLDGVSQTVTEAGPFATDDAAAGFDIFCRRDASNTHEGAIAAVIGFVGAFDTSSRQRHEGYLTAKYGA